MAHFLKQCLKREQTKFDGSFSSVVGKEENREMKQILLNIKAFVIPCLFFYQFFIKVWFGKLQKDLMLSEAISANALLF